MSQKTEERVVILRCAECGLPWARLQDGVLIVESRHHGETHVNALPARRLLAMARQQEREQAPSWLEDVEEK